MGGAHDRFGLIDGWSGDSIPIVGYGSLLSRASIERSLGPVGEVRVARVPGYVRVFDKICAHSLQTGAADPASTRIACCCAQRSRLGELLVSVFEIGREPVPRLLEREVAYGVEEVDFEILGGSEAGSAVMFVRPADARVSTTVTVSRGPEGPVVYSGPAWRGDILPARNYLHRCLRSARELGNAVFDNFMDQSFLADRTVLRRYLARESVESTRDE